MTSAIDHLANQNGKTNWAFEFLTSPTFTDFINLIPEALIISNPDGSIVTVNDMACLVFGYSRQTFLETHIEQLVPERIRNQHAEMRAWFFDNPKPRYLESRKLHLTAVNKDQNEFAIDSALFAIHTDQGLVAVNLIRDITEAQTEQKQLTEYAFIDPLTNLPNRRYFDATLQRTLAKCMRHSHDCSLLFIDLDHFKPINDEQGHEVGDRVLIVASERLNQTIRQEDFIARLGGDEFVILIYPRIDDHELTQLLQRMLNCLRQPVSINQQSFILSASIGVQTNSNGALDASTFTHQADKAMYQAKSKGGDTYAFYDSTES